MSEKFDVIIIGGGPAGCSTALFAHKKKLNVLILDKSKFPRDKTCGDGITNEGLKLIEELGLFDKLLLTPHHKIYDCQLFSSKGKLFDIPLNPDKNLDKLFLICSRHHFDNVLFQEVKNKVNYLESAYVTDLISENGKICGIKCTHRGIEKEFYADCIVGADGFQSIINRKLNTYHSKKNRMAVASRQYFENITNLSNQIEFHFNKKVAPGYIWIFPVSETVANVGVIVMNQKSDKKINIKKLHDECLNLPVLKKRFENATPVSEIKGSFLPLPNFKRKLYGNGFLLVGDAASLVYPHSGEGIKNALLSGKIAAEVLAEAKQNSDYSEQFLMMYEKKLEAYIPKKELKLHYKLQYLTRFVKLLDFLIHCVSIIPNVRSQLIEMFRRENYKDKKIFFSPLFYLKLLIRKYNND